METVLVYPLCLCREAQTASRGGMSDHEEFGMEVKAVCLGAVELIADDGSSESLGVCTM